LDGIALTVFPFQFRCGGILLAVDRGDLGVTSIYSGTSLRPDENRR
jgi:hypothetical protein